MCTVAHTRALPCMHARTHTHISTHTHFLKILKKYLRKRFNYSDQTVVRLKGIVINFVKSKIKNKRAVIMRGRDRGGERSWAHQPGTY